MTLPANDQAIIEAWVQYRIARATFSVLPDQGPMQPDTNYTVAEHEQIEIFHKAGAVIAKGVATSLEALECKLWFALSQCNDEPETFILNALREDDRFFGEMFNTMDWPVKILFSAIQSLRSMQSHGGAK